MYEEKQLKGVDERLLHPGLSPVPRDNRSPEGEQPRFLPLGGERSASRDGKMTAWYRPVAGVPASPLMVRFKMRRYYDVVITIFV